MSELAHPLETNPEEESSEDNESQSSHQSSPKISSHPSQQEAIEDKEERLVQILRQQIAVLEQKLDSNPREDEIDEMSEKLILAQNSEQRAWQTVKVLEMENEALKK